MPWSSTEQVPGAAHGNRDESQTAPTADSEKQRAGHHLLGAGGPALQAVQGCTEDARSPHSLVWSSFRDGAVALDERNVGGLASEDHYELSGELKRVVKLNPSAHKQEVTRSYLSPQAWRGPTVGLRTQ